MGLRKVFAVGVVSFKKVRYSIQSKAVHSHLTPEIQHFENLLLHIGIIKIKVGLMREEAVPEISFCLGIPGPVGGFGICKDYPGVLIFVRIICPYVIIPVFGTFRGTAGFLEPRVLIGSVVDNQFGNNPKSATMRLLNQFFKDLDISIGGINGVVICNIIAVIP